MRVASRRFILLFAMLWLCASSVAEARSPAKWSNTSPAINLTHIFSGDINKKGKASGFHHKSASTDPHTAKVKDVLSGPNRAGVYTAIITLFDPHKKVWKEKFSSMFPDVLKKSQLISAILKAYKNNIMTGGRKWRGPSGLGFTIEGYRLKDGRIITAYPLYNAAE